MSIGESEMEKPVRVPFRCPQCQRIYPSQSFKHRNTCVFCLSAKIRDDLSNLSKKTLTEQHELLRIAEWAYTAIARKIREDLVDIVQIYNISRG